MFQSAQASRPSGRQTLAPNFIRLPVSEQPVVTGSIELSRRMNNEIRKSGANWKITGNNFLV